MNKFTLAVVQARMSSTRLPGKVLTLINGQPMIYWQLKRLSLSKLVNKVVVVISDEPTDDTLADFLNSINQEYIRGSLNNVLDRFVVAEKTYRPTAILRLTADCPLLMPRLIDDCIQLFYEKSVDYLSNTLELSYPDGLDVEIIAAGVLKSLLEFSLSDEEREHVTLGIYSRKSTFKTHNVSNKTNISDFRWTVDTFDDLAFVKSVFTHFESKEINFTFEDMLKFVEDNPKLNRIMAR
jgi:spore coat polysaccharide biosynthesis protein SpsF